MLTVEYEEAPALAPDEAQRLALVSDGRPPPSEEDEAAAMAAAAGAVDPQDLLDQEIIRAGMVPQVRGRPRQAYELTNASRAPRCC